ncbi:MAG: low specificity L-threonine aldolase [Chloroflexi bacterium]|nr:MAG: low specificity L-threonine aldolase [Chloroflexota bacterium]
MREAMYRAEVGDDVYGEDPSINHLQELAAERLGKEAALFVASGTMGNASAIMAHAGRGEAIIVGDQSHIYRYEVGGASTLGGSPMIVIPNEPDGMLNPHLITINMSDGSDEHSAPTVLLCIENTHNRCGGTVLNREQVETLTSLAHSHSMHVHLDGARIFNAAIALNMPVSELVRSVDAVMFSVRSAQQEPLSEVETMQFLAKAQEHGVLMGHIGEGKIRAVTHYGVDAEDIKTALAAIRRTLIDLQV